MLTFDEIKDKLLETFDADLLLELLQIDAEELLDRFEDRLMTHREAILRAIYSASL